MKKYDDQGNLIKQPSEGGGGGDGDDGVDDGVPFWKKQLAARKKNKNHTPVETKDPRFSDGPSEFCAVLSILWRLIADPRVVLQANMNIGGGAAGDYSGPERWCQRCKLIFKDNTCKAGHPVFMYSTKIPAGAAEPEADGKGKGEGKDGKDAKGGKGGKDGKGSKGKGKDGKGKDEAGKGKGKGKGGKGGKGKDGSGKGKEEPAAGDWAEALRAELAGLSNKELRARVEKTRELPYAAFDSFTMVCCHDLLPVCAVLIAVLWGAAGEGARCDGGAGNRRLQSFKACLFTCLYACLRYLVAWWPACLLACLPAASLHRACGTYKKEPTTAVSRLKLQAKT